MTGARGRLRLCQEASPLSREILGCDSECTIREYIPCGAPAVCIVDNGDKHPYWMCEACASHNVQNRGAMRFNPFPVQR